MEINDIEIRNHVANKLGSTVITDSEWRDILCDPKHEWHNDVKNFEQEYRELLEDFDNGIPLNSVHHIRGTSSIQGNFVLAKTVEKYINNPPKANPSTLLKLYYKIKYKVLDKILDWLVGAAITLAGQYLYSVMLTVEYSTQ